MNIKYRKPWRASRKGDFAAAYDARLLEQEYGIRLGSRAKSTARLQWAWDDDYKGWMYNRRNYSRSVSLGPEVKLTNCFDELSLDYGNRSLDLSKRNRWALESLLNGTEQWANLSGYCGWRNPCHNLLLTPGVLIDFEGHQVYNIERLAKASSVMN